MIAKRIGQLDDYLGKMHPSAHAHEQYNSKRNGIQYKNPTGYAPMELEAAT